MNIHELDSYDLGDAVKFNDRLNPAIWDDNERMRPEVREQLLRIADDFREFLGINVEVKDITVSGSNAAYTYTPHSDIDLHLVVDLPRADENAVYRELFDAKKYAYNDMHDIRIGGYDVELYVQDANKTHHSQGIYSIQNDDWVSVPKRRRPDVDDISVRSKFEDLGHRIESAIATGDLVKITDMAEKLRDYRQAGLDAHGEFGAENLAFKILRTQGLIEKLYAARNQAKDELLSLDERKRKKKKRSVKYGYGAYWYPGTAYAGQDHPAGTEGGGDGGGDGGESLREGVPDTQQILQDFVKFAVEDLGIQQMPAIKLRRDPQWPVVNRTFGRYNNDAETLEVAWGQRHIMDVLRTVAHELTHKHQHEREAVPDNAGETGSEFENEANAQAGILMRDYAALHPEYFTAGQAQDLEEGASGYIPTRKQARDPRFSMALTVDIKPGQIGKEANKLKLKTDSQGRPQTARANGLFETLMAEYAQAKEGKQATVAEDQPISWKMPNFDREYDEVEWQLKHGRGRIPQDVLDFYAKYFPTKQAWLKAVRNGRAVEIPVQFGREIRNNTENKKEWLHALSAQSHDPEGPAKKARVDKLFAQGGPIEMPIILNTGQGLWLIGGKTRLGKARLELGIPATVWIIGGKQAVAETAEEEAWELVGQPVPEIQQLVKQMGLANDETGVARIVPVIAATPDTQLPAASIPKLKNLANKPGDPAILKAIQKISGSADAAEQYTKLMARRDSGEGRDRGYEVGNLAAAVKSGNYESPVLLKLPTGIYVIGGRTRLYAALALNVPIRVKILTPTSFAKQTVNEDEELDEVKMSPGALEKFATSDAAKGIRAGFEAELIFRDTQGSSDDIDPEPNYDADERAYSIAQVVEFFENDEYGYGLTDRERNRLEERLDEAYMQWRDEQITSDFRNDAEDLIRDKLLEETSMSERINVYLTDSMQRSDEEADRIIAAGVDAPKFNTSKDQAAYAADNPDYAAYLEAADAAETELDESVEYSVKEQDGYWDEALDDYRDDWSGDDDSFFSDIGLRWMSDVANEYGLDWPVWDLDNQRNEGSRSWEDIGNELAQVIDMPVVVSDNYHSTRRRPGQWILEPDGSLSPDDRDEEAGLEIVSPPMPLLTAIEKLKQVTDWANDPQGGNAYTNSTTGLHMGVSLPTMKSEDATDDIGIDYVKLILFMGDKYVLDQFGRTANTYTASALDKFRQNIKGKKSDPAGVVELLRHGLTELAYRELQKGVGTSKYTSAHIQNGYIEFRSPGGDWLAKSDEEIGILENTMLRFARAMAIAGDPSAERQEYAKKLYKLVTQENPQYADALKLFSEYSAGTINTEQLKKQWADAVLQKEIPSTGQEEYEVYDMANKNSPFGIIDTFYATDYDSAYNQYIKKYSQDPRQLDVRLKQPWFDVMDSYGDIILSVRASDFDRAKEKVQAEYGDRLSDDYEIYRRPDDAPEPEKKLSPRAQVAKRITTKPKTATQYNYDIVDQRTVELRVVDQFRAETPAEAERVYSAWLKSKDLPDDTANYGYRKTAQAADDQRDSVDIQRTLGIRDIDTDVAQNFSPDYSAYERNSDRIDAIRAQAQQPRQNYELVSDEDPDRVIHRMSNATADEVRAWIAQQEAGGMPTGFLRTRIVAESIDPVSGAGAVPPRQDPKSISKKSVTPAEKVSKNPVKGQPYRSAIGQAISQKDLENLTQQIQVARKLGDSVMEMEDTPPEVLRALDQAAQKNGYRNWADVKANPRSNSAVMTVAKLANTIMKTTPPHHAEKLFYKNKTDENFAAGNSMSTKDMIAYLRQHHDTNLHQDYLDHINTFGKFALKNIPVNTLKTELSGLDRTKVERYKQMDFDKAPPIVMGDGYILDGYHRAVAAKELGIPTIKGYVGVKKVEERYARKLNFDEIYGKYLKVTDNDGDPNKEGFSLVTPLNGDSWNWRERPEFKDIVKRKLNQPGWLGDHKYRQIVDAIAGRPYDPERHEVKENFADGKIKGKSRPGRVKRAGASCNGSVTDLRARAKRASGEKAKMYHWCANMKSGRKK